MEFNNQFVLTETQIRAALRKWCIIDKIQDEVIKDLTALQGDSYALVN
jgi:hypothetical protein